MSLTHIGERLAAERLAIFGGLHPAEGDGAPKGTGTLLLIGPMEPGFWAHVTTSPEWGDARPDPLDRWSRRVIGRIACAIGAKAVFPFGGPPFAPFTAWARASGRAFASPVGLLVHAEAGLMVSYRGALALKERLDLPPPVPSPCENCLSRPCLSACPVNALQAEHYDVAGCRSYLGVEAGTDCRTAGCLARRACPVSGRYGRVGGQSAYHMGQFLS